MREQIYENRNRILGMLEFAAAFSYQILCIFR